MIEITPDYGSVMVVGGIGLVVFAERPSGVVLGAIRFSGDE